MPSHAILVAHSANRVYNADASRLGLAEAAALAPSLTADVEDLTVETLGDVEYLTFTTADDLADDDLRRLADLSTTRAIFRRADDGGLHPRPLPRTAEHGDDLVTIQRYKGKTNEQFTHLLVNVTVAASEAARRREAKQERVRLLDPVAGRGSTLNRGLVYGFDVAGIEHDARAVNDYRVFLSTYLKDHRVKHRIDRERIRNGELAGTDRFAATLKSGQRLGVVGGDATLAPVMFPGYKFDVLVGDLPYGVQHRATTGGGPPRGADELLEASLDAWRRVLLKGGTLGLSWNVRTLPRAGMLELLEAHGFEPVDHPHSFEHVVDRSITRDLVVARR